MELPDGYYQIVALMRRRSIHGERDRDCSADLRPHIRVARQLFREAVAARWQSRRGVKIAPPPFPDALDYLIRELLAANPAGATTTTERQFLP